MTRNEAREIMMQILFELDASKTIKNDETEDRSETKKRLSSLAKEMLSGGHVERADKLIGQIIDNLDDIDAGIEKHSTKWKISRMPKVDLAVMRLACGELRFSEDVPEAVVVNEAINLAKKYGTDNSSKFVHGLLGAIIRDEK